MGAQEGKLMSQPSKKLVVIAGGLGNQIQMTAAIATLEKRLGWEIEVVAGGAPIAAAELREWLPWPAHRPAWRPEKGEFDGAVALTYGSSHMVQEDGWIGIPWMNDLSRQAIGYTASEVDVSMNACRDLGIEEHKLDWHGVMNYDEDYDEKFDVVLANNYHKGVGERLTTHWDVKGYPGFASVAAGIQKRWPRLSVCSIGLDNREYIHGTVDRTGLTLGQTLALIARAKFVVSTDSMAFHAAGAFATPTVGLFTATSTVKNADPRFHARAVIVGRDDLDCRKDCQAATHRWHGCKHWRCQEIGVDAVADAVETRVEAVHE